jgi:hypothetical protein
VGGSGGRRRFGWRPPGMSFSSHLTGLIRSSHERRRATGRAY